MIKARWTFLTLAAVSVAVYACGEPSGQSSRAPLVTAPSYAPSSSSCDVKSLLGSARNYFSSKTSPTQKSVMDTLNAISSACDTPDAAHVVSGSWWILSAIESVSSAGTNTSIPDGVDLANGMIAYMCQDGMAPNLCDPQPAPILAADLDNEGIFAVRGNDATDVVEHGKVGFTFSSVANNALWGVQVTPGSTWGDVTGADPILVYGHPSTLTVEDVSIGGLAFRLHTFPDVAGWAEDGKLHVGVCYDTPIDLTSTADANLLQRNGTLLEAYKPTFAPQCNPTASRSVLGSLFAMVRHALLPQPLLADVAGSAPPPPSSGGSPYDFSHFAPVGAGTAGSLQFVTPPTDGVDGVTLAPFRVEALSGGGTALELVPITLSLESNNGEPAGATFCDPNSTSCSDTTAITRETDNGYGTSALFGNVTIYKPGGYTICARATSPIEDERGIAVTFQGVCATIHIKNN